MKRKDWPEWYKRMTVKNRIKMKRTVRRQIRKGKKSTTFIPFEEVWGKIEGWEDKWVM